MPDVYIYEYKLLNKTRSTLIVIFIRSYVGLCIEFEKCPVMEIYHFGQKNIYCD